MTAGGGTAPRYRYDETGSDGLVLNDPTIGIPALALMDDPGSYPFYHSSADTVGRLDGKKLEWIEQYAALLVLAAACPGSGMGGALYRRLPGAGEEERERLRRRGEQVTRTLGVDFGPLAGAIADEREAGWKDSLGALLNGPGRSARASSSAVRLPAPLGAQLPREWARCAPRRLTQGTVYSMIDVLKGK